MKAPDKIYLQRMPSNQEVIDGCTVEPVKHTVLEDIEYIRKDALLEYLTERRKGLSSGDSFVAGERKMLREIIDKIESL